MSVTWREASRETRTEKELRWWQMLFFPGFFFLYQALNIAISLMCISFHLHQSQSDPINSTYKFEFSNKWSVQKYGLILVLRWVKQLLVYPFYEIRLSEALF